MSKLEEGLKEVKRQFWEEGDLSVAGFEFLLSQAERVEELEEEIYQDNRQAVLEGLYEENQRYKDLLTDFANAGENIDDLYYYQDKARQALKDDTQ